MLDRVLDQRLQDQRGNERTGRLRVDDGLDLKPTLKAHLHDVQILPEKMELLLDGDLRLSRTLECVAQQLAQARDHAADSAWIALNQS